MSGNLLMRRLSDRDFMEDSSDGVKAYLEGALP